MSWISRCIERSLSSEASLTSVTSSFFTMASGLAAGAISGIEGGRLRLDFRLGVSLRTTGTVRSGVEAREVVCEPGMEGSWRGTRPDREAEERSRCSPPFFGHSIMLKSMRGSSTHSSNRRLTEKRSGLGFLRCICELKHHNYVIYSWIFHNSLWGEKAANWFFCTRLYILAVLESTNSFRTNKFVSNAYQKSKRVEAHNRDFYKNILRQ